MTAIGGQIAATAKSGDLGIHSLDQFVLSVPDGSVAENFYKEFGLDVSGKDNTLSLKTFGQDHVWGSVIEGPTKNPPPLVRLLRAGYRRPQGAHRGQRRQVDRRAAGLREQRFLVLRLRQFADRGEGRGEVLARHQVRCELAGCAGQCRQCADAPQGRAGPAAAAVARPHLHQRLTGAIDFYSRNLGLQLSDRSRDIVAFMHGIHGSDHHLLAFAKSDSPGFHHCSWDVGSVGVSASVRSTWRPRAIRRAGASAAMSSGRTSSTTSATRGAVTRNTPATSTTSRARTTGRRAITIRRTRSISGARRPRTTSPSTTNRQRPERLTCRMEPSEAHRNS